MQTSIKYAIAVSLVALSFMIIAIQPALAEYNQRYYVQKTSGVQIGYLVGYGEVIFFSGDTDVGGFFVPPPYEQDEYYEHSVNCLNQPDKVSWNITIMWGDGSSERWEGVKQPWPKTYMQTKPTRGEFVAFGPAEVGGVIIPIDKFGLLAPYIGLASTTMVGAVATVVYAKHIKCRKEKQ